MYHLFMKSWMWYTSKSFVHAYCWIPLFNSSALKHICTFIRVSLESMYSQTLDTTGLLSISVVLALGVGLHNHFKYSPKWNIINVYNSLKPDPNTLVKYVIQVYLLNHWSSPDFLRVSIWVCIEVDNANPLAQWSLIGTFISLQASAIHLQ